jgi:hypothetical protein
MTDWLTFIYFIVLASSHFFADQGNVRAQLYALWPPSLKVWKHDHKQMSFSSQSALNQRVKNAKLRRPALQWKEEGTGLPDGLCIFKPKIPIWGNFGGPWN